MSNQSIYHKFVTMKNKSLILPLILIAVAAMARLLPHPPNFSPVGSIALFGGAVLASKYFKYLVPVLALFISDLILNNTLMRSFYPDETGMIIFSEYMIWTYVAFILAVVIGHVFIKKISMTSVIGGALGFTVVFFLISNFGAWLSIPTYPKTMSGLIACMAAGLPFIKASLIGNLAYSTFLFGSYYMISQLMGYSIYNKDVLPNPIIKK